MDINNILNLLLLGFGFGFVIFWHELGHFLAAKVTGVKVEQFAVGFGQALICYRKGLGIRVGGTHKEYLERAKAAVADRGGDPVKAGTAELDAAAAAIGLSETEYRLNWLPLGGYVKMLGQDDLDPNSTSTDPRSYNKVSVPRRMLIISAGVIMNIILAGILFGLLFTVGFNSPPPVVGNVQPGSGAQNAGVEVGDRLISFDGSVLHDFTKVSLAVPLADAGEQVPLVVERGGERMTLMVEPLPAAELHDALQLGVGPTPSLAAPDLDGVAGPLKPGDVIVAVEGQAVERDEYAVLDRALQAASGRPVDVIVRDKTGAERSEQINAEFMSVFGEEFLPEFAGIRPRLAVRAQGAEGKAALELQPGDVITALRRSGGSDTLLNPDFRSLKDFIQSTGEAGATMHVTLIRAGEQMEFADVTPVRIAGSPLLFWLTPTFGLNFLPTIDNASTVVGQVVPGSLADEAGLESGMQIAAVNGVSVSNWSNVDEQLRQVEADVPITFTTADGAELSVTPAQSDLATLAMNRYAPVAAFAELKQPRKADNIGQAMWWGVTETQDMVTKFYLTLRQIFRGGLSAKNLQGPVGILHTGTILSGKGTDWMIWFLAVISANLAVVNFLPLPILDGGHMVFLAYEGATGKRPSEKFHIATQFAGLALIAALFLFVTFNDIVRLAM